MNGSDRFLVQRMGGEDGPYSVMDLQMMVKSGQIKDSTPARKESGGQWFPVSEIPGLYSDKEWLVALLLSVFVGWLGIDRFYLGFTGLGILKILTCGGCGVWWLIDVILISTRKLRDSRDLPLRG
jgi:hypothetical protein